MIELHSERARDLELSACDQDQLAELRSAIAEQGFVNSLFLSCSVKLISPALDSAQVDDYSRTYGVLSGQLEVLTNKATELATRESLLSAEVDALRHKNEEGRSFTKRTFIRMNGQSIPPLSERRSTDDDAKSSRFRSAPTAPFDDSQVLHRLLYHSRTLRRTRCHAHYRSGWFRLGSRFRIARDEIDSWKMVSRFDPLPGVQGRGDCAMVYRRRK